MSALEEIRGYDPLSVVEAYEEVRHPRGRGGEWRRISFKQAGTGRKLEGHDLGNGLAVVHRHNGVSGIAEHQVFHHESGHQVAAIGDKGENRGHVHEAFAQHFAGEDYSGKSVEELRRNEKLREKAKTVSKVAHGFASSRERRAANAAKGFRESGFDPLTIEETAHVAIHFDPALHPRNRRGEFAAVLSRLHRRGEVVMPHGVSVQRGSVGGFKVSTPHGDSHTMDAAVAVQRALSAHDNAAPRPESGRMSAGQADALGLWSPGGSRERGLAQVELERGANRLRPRIRAEDRAAYTERDTLPPPPSPSFEKTRERVSKAQALVDAGLADDLADARRQLKDMGEFGLASPGGERQTARVGGKTFSFMLVRGTNIVRLNTWSERNDVAWLLGDRGHDGQSRDAARHGEFATDDLTDAELDAVAAKLRSDPFKHDRVAGQLESELNARRARGGMASPGGQRTTARSYLDEPVSFGGEELPRGEVMRRLMVAARAQFPTEPMRAQQMVDRYMQGLGLGAAR